MHSSGVHTAERLTFKVEGGGTDVDAEGVGTRDELDPVGAHQADDRREREARARRSDMAGGGRVVEGREKGEERRAPYNEAESYARVAGTWKRGRKGGVI